MRGRSDCRLASLTAHAGLRKKLMGQEPSQPGKLIRPCRIEKKACGAGGFQVGKPITPCRIEKKACGAGAIPGQQAFQTLPD